jgi:hypothetical protein
VREARELDGATFRPDLSPSRQRGGESMAVSACAQCSLCFQETCSSEWHVYHLDLHQLAWHARVLSAGVGLYCTPAQLVSSVCRSMDLWAEGGCCPLSWCLLSCCLLCYCCRRLFLPS